MSDSHTTTRGSLGPNLHPTTSQQIPGRSLTHHSPVWTPFTSFNQSGSAIPTQTLSRNTAAQFIPDSTPIHSPRDAVTEYYHRRQSLTSFNDLPGGAEVTGGNFVNATAPVSLNFHNEGPSTQPIDNLHNVAMGNSYSTRENSGRTLTGGPQNAAYDIYYHHLLSEGRGTPLWKVGPDMNLPIEYRKNGVSIGDVGIVYRTGDFDFLFNIFLPADHEINRGRVPNGFVPLDKSKLEKFFKKSVDYDCGSCLASSSVRRTDSSKFAFQATGEGAVLVMPDGAISEDLRKYKLVTQYIADNAKRWYEYVEIDMQIENGDIRVVVGMDKVSSWGMATFHAEEPLRFEFKDDTGVLQARRYRWDGVVAGRAGPPEEEIQDLWEGNTSPPRNQCVFVRTLNISVSGKVRDELAVHEIRASRFRDHIPDSSWHQATLPGHRTVNIQPPQVGLPVSDPSKRLNQYLLQKCPDAKVVITKDTDWMSVITENDTIIPSFEDICARVLTSHIICQKEGVVTLKKRKNIFSAGSISDTSFGYQRFISKFWKTCFVVVAPWQCCV